MANPKHLKILKQGVKAWIKWCEDNPDVRPDFIKANLSGADLSMADLSEANLSRANLSEADLGAADLQYGSTERVGGDHGVGRSGVAAGIGLVGRGRGRELQQDGFRGEAVVGLVVGKFRDHQ